MILLWHCSTRLRVCLMLSVLSCTLIIKSEMVLSTRLRGNLCALRRVPAVQNIRCSKEINCQVPIHRMHKRTVNNISVSPGDLFKSYLYRILMSSCSLSVINGLFQYFTYQLSLSVFHTSIEFLVGAPKL